MEQVWQLHYEGVRETRPANIQVDPQYEEDLRNIEAEYLSEGSCLWVVDANGDRGLVGMAAVRRIDAQTGRLRRMRVTGPRRREGVARQLLETVEEFCRSHGYRRIILDTMEQQTAAQRLYEGAGFTRIGKRDLGSFRVVDYEKVLR